MHDCCLYDICFCWPTTCELLYSNVVHRETMYPRSSWPRYPHCTLPYSAHQGGPHTQGEAIDPLKSLLQKKLSSSVERSRPAFRWRWPFRPSRSRAFHNRLPEIQSWCGKLSARPSLSLNGHPRGQGHL